MAANLHQLFRMYALYARMDWHFLMRDKRTGFLNVFSDWLATLSSISGIALLAVRFDGIGGLSADEILWMLGFFTLADGATWMLLGSNNALHISRRVGRGQVDHMLIQPVPLWMQLLTEGFMPFSGNSGFIAGVILTAVATSRLQMALSPGWFAMLILYILARMAVAAGCAFLSGSAAFYRPVACEELSTVALDALNAAGKYPLIALPEWLRLLFSTVLPVSLMAYLPSMILLQKIDAPAAAVWPFAMGAAFLALAGLAFRKGLHHYASHGCPRYKDMGHRC